MVDQNIAKMEENLNHNNKQVCMLNGKFEKFQAHKDEGVMAGFGPLIKANVILIDKP